jgi:hypothetical protein
VDDSPAGRRAVPARGLCFRQDLDGADPIECLNVAFALNLPPEDVPWCSQPPGTAWLVDNLRLDTGGIA